MKQKLLHVFLIFIGNTLLAFALSTLLLENKIIAGGVSGIGIIINHYYGISIAQCVAVMNIVLFLLGLLFLGKTFAMTSLLSTILFPFLLQFFETQPIFHHYLDDPLLAAIIAGCMIGAGIGLILRANASTGGVDIIALLINRKWGFPVHKILNGIDMSILLLQFTFSDTTHVIYGIVTVMTTTYMLHKTLTMGTSLMQLVVVSDHYEAIKDMIMHEYDAGVTLLASEKGYTGASSRLVLSVLPYRKLPLIREKVNDIDALAFLIVSHVDEVGGKGFTLERQL